MTTKRRPAPATNPAPSLLSPTVAADEPWPFESAITGLVEVTGGPIDFAPVPRIRRRRNGWTENTQRAFIEALARCGCVARAARSVAMTSRSAYRLLDAEGADSFAEAWDQAIARGTERLRADAMDRALNGAWVPVQRRGKIVRFEHRINDRLAIALLSGRNHGAADHRERASSRRRYRLKLLAERKAEAEKRLLAEQVWAEHQAILDAIEAEREDPSLRIIVAAPRIRSL